MSKCTRIPIFVSVNFQFLEQYLWIGLGDKKSVDYGALTSILTLYLVVEWFDPVGQVTQVFKILSDFRICPNFIDQTTTEVCRAVFTKIRHILENEPYAGNGKF